jgi:alpha-L-rhamnosidase
MSSDLRPTNLRCEHLIDPIGIDFPRPRFSWRFDTERHGASQAAYRIQTSNGWDTGLVESDETLYIPYEGPELQSRERVEWTVTVWDEQGAESDEVTASFEMGLLSESDWLGQWIGGDLVGGPRTPVPAPFVRKAVCLRSRPVRARLYATARGVYELRINGSKVGQDFFQPGWTDYRQRIQYQAYDVTAMLGEGENVLGGVLGDGWFCGNVEWRGRQLYGDRPWLLAQLVVTYEDGTEEVFATGEDWRVAYGPILEADMLMGESYDARLEMRGWDEPRFDDSAWRPVQIGPKTDAKLVAMQGPPVRATEELTPISDPTELRRWPTSDYIFDLGQNMVGVVRLNVKGPAGTTIRLRFGEVLDKGALYTENLRSAKQTDYYTLRGDEDGEVWEPKFTFHGFRYVEVRGFPGVPTRDAITGIVLHSDTPKTGHFECSDELVNQLQRNIDWGQRGNFIDIPTDCPQRDERLGWTGDAQVFVRTAAFNRDVAGFFAKWQDDLRDSQGAGGQIPPTAPTTGVVGDDGGPAWADAVIICPWTIYRCYGDKGLLERHYDSMKAYVGYLSATSTEHIRCHPDYKGFRGFGDWLSINAHTTEDLIGTAFYAYSARLLSEVANVLGHDADAARYDELFREVREAFRNRFVTPDGLVGTGSQTGYLLALHFDLLEEKHRAGALQALVDDIGRRGWKLSAGFVGSSYLNPVLTELGRNDVAYKLLCQKEWPSWLYAVTHGATTIWERWDGWTHDKGFQDVGMNSFNHYAYGAIGMWLYQRVAGIDLDPDAPGYKRILLRPTPGEGLTHARATLDSIRGRIESAWRIEDGLFRWEVLVPANTVATAVPPTAIGKWEVKNGEWEPFDPRDASLPPGRYRYAGDWPS